MSARLYIGVMLALCGWGLGAYFLLIGSWSIWGGVVGLNAGELGNGIISLLLGFPTWWFLLFLGSLYGIPRPKLRRRRRL